MTELISTFRNPITNGGGQRTVITVRKPCGITIGMRDMSGGTDRTPIDGQRTILTV